MTTRKSDSSESKPSGKIVQATPLSYQGNDIPADADLRDVLPSEVLAACLARGEAVKA